MFLAVRYQPGFGPLAIADAVANIASALPITPGGLGVVEVTLVAVTVGFGAPRPTAVLAVVGRKVTGPAGRVIKRPRPYVYWRRMLANGAGSVSVWPVQHGLRRVGDRGGRPDAPDRADSSGSPARCRRLNGTRVRAPAEHLLGAHPGPAGGPPPQGRWPHRAGRHRDGQARPGHEAPTCPTRIRRLRAAGQAPAPPRRPGR